MMIFSPWDSTDSIPQSFSAFIIRGTSTLVHACFSSAQNSFEITKPGFLLAIYIQLDQQAPTLTRVM
jgi:hypothetical protein